MKNGIPKFCIRCKTNAVAWTKPRMDFCYDCLPGGPFTPPPCQHCGSLTDYYSSGLCQLCHPRAPQQPGSCRDCYAWGVVRKHKWLCWGCRTWRVKNSIGRCVSCDREVAVDDQGACRLCWRHAASLRWTKNRLTLQEANRHGQQLFLANLHQRSQRDRRPTPPRQMATPPRQMAAPGAVAPVAPPVGHRQLALLDLPRDLAAGKRHGFPPPAEPAVAEGLVAELREYAAGRGWSAKTIKRTRRGLEIVLGLQDTPGAPIPASLIHELPTIDLNAGRVHEFLDTVGLGGDDRTPAIDKWLDRQLDGLPEPMHAELLRWWDVMWNGHTTPPRSRARQQNTAQYRLKAALPALRGWAASGATSLRQITRGDVEAALPDGGRDRYTAGSGLRAIFRVLKVHKIVFVDPTAKLSLGAPYCRQPLPADLAVLREGLHAADPTRALMTALLAFHALRAGQLRRLQLTDIRDGRLHLGERSIPLAEPVRTRLAAYLDYRNMRWPNTANAHLFIHYRSALDTKPVGGRWLSLVLGTAARGIRTDRILDEVRATRGDLRRICDLFGLSVAGASRYTTTLDLIHENPGHERAADTRQ